ncbi:unnamed protein product, partial [Mesorhabditis spiculigera]
MQAETPPELRQCFRKTDEPDFPIGLKGEDAGGSAFLIDCGGFYKDFLAVWRSENLSIYDVFTKSQFSAYAFEKGSVVQDVFYHHLTSEDPAGHPGVIVAVNNDEKKKYLVCLLALVPNGSAKLLSRIVIQHKITTVRTLISSFRMEKVKGALHPKMGAMPNIIAVGTENGHCYLANTIVGAFGDEENLAEEKTARWTDALKDFHSRDDKAEFLYDAAGMRNTVIKPVDEVSVSSLGFVDRARALVIGLNFGGLVLVSLSYCPSIITVPHPMFGSVPKHIVSMVPENDPRPRLYFAVSFDASARAAGSVFIFAMEFPEDEKERINDPSTWEYNELHAFPYLTISTPDMRVWLSMRCIVGNECKYHNDPNETMSLDTGPSAAHSRTLLSFFYLSRDSTTRDLRLMGGLYDLNQHYFKRQIPKMLGDGSLAAQCPFVCFFKQDIGDDDQKFSLTLNDVLIDPSHVSRFVSDVSTELALFYPSTYRFPNIYLSNGRKLAQYAVDPLHEQVLQRIAKNLRTHVCAPETASEWLSAIGLLEAPSVDANNYIGSCRARVLFNVMQHLDTSQIVDMCNSLDDPLPPPLLEEIFCWIWRETERQFQTMQDITDPLFRGITAEMNEADQRSLTACESTFRAAQRLFSSYKRYPADQGPIWELRTHAAQSFLQYLSLVYAFIYNRLLPIDEQTRRTTNLMREKMGKRIRAAEQKNKSLYLTSIIAKITDQKSDDSGMLWLTDGLHSYPPTLLDIVSLFPLFETSERCKRALLIYYLLDYYSCSGCSEPALKMEEFVATVGRKLKLTWDEAKIHYQGWVNDTALERCAGEPNQDLADSFDNGPLGRDPKVELMEMVSKRLDTYLPEEKLKIQRLIRRVYGEPLDKIVWNVLLFDHGLVDDFDTEIYVEEGLHKDAYVERYLLVANQIRHQVRGGSLGARHKLSDETLTNHLKRNSEVHHEGEHTARLSAFRTANINRKRQSLTNEPAFLNRSQSKPIVGLETPTVQQIVAQPVTPPITRQLVLEEDEESIIAFSNVPHTELERLREIVRTPKARASAAARAEGLHANMVTPEQNRDRPAPTSILRSAHKQTPTRGNIRWDPEIAGSDENSVEQTSIPPDPTLPIPVLPNFDSDDDMEGEESEIKKTPRNQLVDYTIADTTMNSVASTSFNQQPVRERSFEEGQDDEEEFHETLPAGEAEEEFHDTLPAAEVEDEGGATEIYLDASATEPTGTPELNTSQRLRSFEEQGDEDFDEVPPEAEVRPLENLASPSTTFVIRRDEVLTEPEKQPAAETAETKDVEEPAAEAVEETAKTRTPSPPKRRSSSRTRATTESTAASASETPKRRSVSRTRTTSQASASAETVAEQPPPKSRRSTSRGRPTSKVAEEKEKEDAAQTASTSRRSSSRTRAAPQEATPRASRADEAKKATPARQLFPRNASAAKDNKVEDRLLNIEALLKKNKPGRPKRAASQQAESSAAATPKSAARAQRSASAAPAKGAATPSTPTRRGRPPKVASPIPEVPSTANKTRVRAASENKKTPTTPSRQRASRSASTIKKAEKTDDTPKKPAARATPKTAERKTPARTPSVDSSVSMKNARLRSATKTKLDAVQEERKDDEIATPKRATRATKTTAAAKPLDVVGLYASAANRKRAQRDEKDDDQPTTSRPGTGAKKAKK